MSKGEDVKAHLEAQKSATWVASRTKVLKAVPNAGEWLQYRVGDDGVVTKPVREKAKSFFASRLSDQDRATLFKGLFPKMPAVVERAWQDLANAPYQMNQWNPAAFRAPNDAAMIARVRDQWLGLVVDELRGFDPDPIWLATWGGHLGYSGITESTRLLAAAMDLGEPEGKEVFDILAQSASNQHEIGVMGNHVILSMMECARPDAWEFLADLLIAAQRQEGLRQSILETAHVGHPGAFRRMLGVILDENLVRFASTVRAIDLWFGLLWDSMAAKTAQTIVETVVSLLDDPTQRAKAIAGKNAESTYLALWCEAFYDARKAITLANSLVKDRTPDRRWVGVHLLGRLEIPDTIDAIIPLINDADMRVAARAFDAVHGMPSSPESDSDDDASKTENPHALARRAAIFDRMESLLERIAGKHATFEPMVFPWGRKQLAATEVGAGLVQICPPTRTNNLIGLLTRFDANARASAAYLMAGVQRRYFSQEPIKIKPLSPEARDAMILLLGDPATEPRNAAGSLLAASPPTPAEIARHEALLDRTASDVRTRAIARILSLDDPQALASATRLLAMSRSHALAGLDVLRGMVERRRSVPAAKATAIAFRDAQTKPVKEIIAAIDAILADGDRTLVTPADAFGLAKPYQPRPLITPRTIAQDDARAAAVACIWSLNDLIEANKTFELRSRNDEGKELDAKDEGRLLGSIRYYTYGLDPRNGLSAEVDRARCPVRPLLDQWMLDRAEATRDRDGLEFVRAWILCERVQDDYGRKTVWPSDITTHAPKGVKGHPNHHRAIAMMLEWLLRLGDLDPSPYFLDQMEGAAARGDIARKADSLDEHDLKDVGISVYRWLKFYYSCPGIWAVEHNINTIRRLDSILRAASDTFAEQVAARAAKKSARAKDDEDGQQGDDDASIASFLELRLAAFLALWEAGDVCDDELMVRVVRPPRRTHYFYDSVDELERLSQLRLPAKQRRRGFECVLTPRLDAIIEKLRTRILEIELARGDAPTPATPHATSLDPSGGIDAVIPALSRLARLRLVRGYISNPTPKPASFSTIILNSRPGPSDTPEAFAKAAKEAGLSDTRLVELALYQPRWTSHVEHTLGWEGLEEGVLWLRTHTKESKTAYRIEEDREPWEAKAAELTPISPQSLADGAVDRAWFERCYKKLGSKRWEILYDAAKYASSSGGHTRARLFADAMLGEVTEKELTQRIQVKRHQDAARALGLLAISPGDAGRKQVLARYRILQEMRRTSRKHGGSMLQASEKRAVEISMENLAWTAGYPDPLRLQWAMEIEELGDLAKGPVSVKVDQTEVTLSIDDEGTASLTAIKAGKPLKSVPPAIKKDKRVAELAERLTNLRRQGTRIRLALESAMCRGDSFAGDELATLFSHPLLRSALARLVLVGTTKSGGMLTGYPDKDGKALRQHDGSLEPLKASDSLRIAHPLDLLATKQWHEWQRECFKAERVQPFKQIFREIYTPIEAELAKGDVIGSNLSRRYAGQQVQPRQSLALFGARGWVARAEEGVQRTFHHEGVTVHVEFEEGFYTPAEIDGLTLAGVSFSRAGKYESMPIRDVPPRVFSEVMRDLDLVVSVAHRGEVDPEASHSTVEMRAALLKETCSLLSLANVRLERARAIIKGEIGEYALHLASGTIHKLPGGTIWVIPVHSQHRGRIFLPFADDDPKTAEIISKALLLARDREIQDPAILAQIRSS